MRTPLLIIGAGNVGGFLSYNIEEFGVDYDVIGFLDDDTDKIGKELYGRKVLGPISSIDKYLTEEPAIVIGIANPVIKQKIASRLSGSGLSFPSFISKNAWVSNHVEVGKGVILYPGVSINYESFIGDFVIMNMNCAIGHNCTISEYSSLAPGVNLAGFTYIDKVVDVGIGVSTRQGIHIGTKSTIGGQTMLVKDVQPDSRVIGVPGKEMN